MYSPFGGGGILENLIFFFLFSTNNQSNEDVSYAISSKLDNKLRLKLKFGGQPFAFF